MHLPEPLQRYRWTGWPPRGYLCTDARRDRGDLAEFADAALAGGVDIIQLRDKGSAGERKFGPLEARQELEALEVLADAARRHGALFAVNDRADIANAAGADVLHLGQDDLPLQVARDVVGDRPVLGRSCHDVAQMEYAVQEPGTTSASARAGPHRPNRAALRRAWTWSAPPRGAIPAKAWFAIGGIDEARLPQVLEAGATRVVVVGRSRTRTIRGLVLPGWRLRWTGRDRHSGRHGPQPLPAGRESGMQRQIGHLVLGHPAQFGALPVGHGLQQAQGVGDDRRVGPVRLPVGRADLRGHHAGAHPRARRAARLLMGFPHGRLLGGLVANRGLRRQRPGAALMTPGRAVLQQHRRATVRPKRAQRRSGRTVPTPVVWAPDSAITQPSPSPCTRSG